MKKLNIILEELEIHPQTGTGNPEQLKHQLSGFWSRRINKKDRLIYEIIEEPEKLVVVVSALGHY
jgi:toxin YoeB